MDSYSSIDSIQVEKANAIARYKKFNDISKIFKVIEVFVFVVLITWSSTRLPTVFKLSVEYLYTCSYYILNQHVIFLLGNFIVLVCYFLSRQTEIGNESVTDSVTPEDDGYGYSYKYTTTSSVESKITESGLVVETVEPPVQEVKVDAVVCNENTIVTKTETDVAAIKKSEKQIERFKRTQSAKLKRDISMRPRRELRRSVTERRRSDVDSTERRRSDVDSTERRNSDGDTSAAAVERLSNEEFRLAVEAFILKQQSLIKQQSVVEN